MLACKHLLISTEDKVWLRMMELPLVLNVFSHKQKCCTNTSAGKGGGAVGEVVAPMFEKDAAKMCPPGR